MENPITDRHWNDDKGNPEGGHTYGNGFAIAWQRGPLGRGESRQPPNGAFVEDVIRAAAKRLEFYQAGKFACESNARALDHLYEALESLRSRTKEREEREVEGTHAS